MSIAECALLRGYLSVSVSAFRASWEAVRGAFGVRGDWIWIDLVRRAA